MADEVLVSCESAALVQKSVLTQPGFYGDPSLKDSTSSFGQAVTTCVNLAGAASVLQQRNAPANYVRTPSNYILTGTEKSAITLKATQLAALGFVPFDVLEKFFYILASMDKLSDLIFVGDVMGIPELGDQRYIRNIRGILAIPTIYKVGFLANGVASVIQAFSPQLSNARNATNNTVNNILSLVSAAGALAGPILEQTGGLAIGNYMSELLTGSRLTSQQIARNPSLTPPSYQGKAFFGENNASIPAVDQLFCRRIGAFNQEQGSNGSVSFGFQNFASFGGGMNMTSAITKMVMGTGVVPPATTFIGQQMLSMVSNVTSILNVQPSTSIEMRRSDNAIPFLIGLTCGIAESTKCPFSTNMFTQGWQLASSVGNDVQKQNPQYIETCRTSL